ncbi:MAG: alkaline phosphatase family protein [Proteobacteria bacterium]|nr:alkaline phosphatase family protein [Pseudomonadota bacterium]
MVPTASSFPQQPDYAGGSLVNLMQSLVLGRGGTAVEPYVPTPLLPAAEVQAARHVVLIVLDGLGSHYLAQHGAQGPLARHLRGQLTTVFPSTTAATITTLVTATAPQQHAVTGWFMYLRELGTVAAILPFKPRWGSEPFDKSGVAAEGLIAAPPLFPRLTVSSYFLVPQPLVDSAFSRAAARGAQRVGYQGMGGCCQTVSGLIGASGANRCFIYVYWPEFDALSHKHGNGSAQVLAQFRDIERTFGQLLSDCAAAAPWSWPSPITASSTPAWPRPCSSPTIPPSRRRWCCRSAASHAPPTATCGPTGPETSSTTCRRSSLRSAS